MAQKKDIIVSEYITEGAIYELSLFYKNFDEDPLFKPSKKDIEDICVLLLLSKSVDRIKTQISMFSSLTRKKWNLKDVIGTIYDKNKAARVRRLLARNI